MSELSDKIVHIAYRFKPEGSDKYVTAYMESSLSDVIIPPETQSAMLGASNMQDFCELLMTKIRQEQPIYQKASAYDKNRVYPKGKFLYEADTGRLKVADGVSTYSEIKYFGYSNGQDLNPTEEHTADNGNVACTFIDEHGVEQTTVIPETIVAYPPEEEPGPDYEYGVYAVIHGTVEGDSGTPIEGDDDSGIIIADGGEG